MDVFLEVVGWGVFGLLVVVGLIAGALAGWIAGRDRLLYLVMGVIGAVALPIVLLGLGVGLLAAGGVLALLFFAAIGAVLLLALVHALFGRSRSSGSRR